MHAISTRFIYLNVIFWAVALACIAYVFVKSGTLPANRTAPASIISLKDISPGSFVEVEWRDRPIGIFRPSERTAKDLLALNASVHGPKFPFRDNRVFIYERVGTHRGCGAIYRTENEGGNIEGIMWFGGWIDPCHFGAWDNAGRAYIRKPETDKSSQLPNFATPKWRYVSTGEIELL